MFSVWGNQGHDGESYLMSHNEEVSGPQFQTTSDSMVLCCLQINQMPPKFKKFVLGVR